MSQHLDHDTLLRFVEGDLGEHMAIYAAEHIDDCPVCANRARELDDLSMMFASIDVPEVPDDLADAILGVHEEASRPARLPVGQVAAGLGLILAAMITRVAVLGGAEIVSGPLSAVRTVVRFAYSTLLQHPSLVLLAFGGALVLAMSAILGVRVTWRYANPAKA